MFLDDEGQRRAREHLLEATVLRSLGGRSPEEVTLHEAPSRERYRTRARLAFSGKRGLAVGYRRPRSHQIERVSRCLVLAPALEPLLDRLRAWLKDTRGEGEISLALGLQGKPVLDLRWTRGEPPASLFASLEGAVREGELAGASVLSEGARSPAVVGDPTAWTEGADGEPLEAPAFAQAHPGVAAQIGEHLRRLTGRGRPSVVELFAGAGTFTALLAPGNPSYVAVEESQASCEAARRNLERRGLSHARVQQADASTWKIPPKTSLVILDPPRTGARPVAEGLASSSVAEVLYVSCDPATLARDLSILTESRYEVRSLHGFDLFPQTSHLEVVAHLKRC
jgi:23S rRNA (uracil1939-C5)-methyltransferase